MPCIHGLGLLPGAPGVSCRPKTVRFITQHAGGWSGWLRNPSAVAPHGRWIQAWQGLSGGSGRPTPSPHGPSAQGQEQARHRLGHQVGGHAHLDDGCGEDLAASEAIEAQEQPDGAVAQNRCRCAADLERLRGCDVPVPGVAVNNAAARQNVEIEVK